MGIWLVLPFGVISGPARKEKPAPSPYRTPSLPHFHTSLNLLIRVLKGVFVNEPLTSKYYTQAEITLATTNQNKKYIIILLVSPIYLESVAQCMAYILARWPLRVFLVLRPTRLIPGTSPATSDKEVSATAILASC